MLKNMRSDLLNSPHLSVEAKGWIQALSMLREANQLNFGSQEIGYQFNHKKAQRIDTIFGIYQGEFNSRGVACGEGIWEPLQD